jgi:uncharacterized protein YbaR (Trm112 family)
MDVTGFLAWTAAAVATGLLIAALVLWVLRRQRRCPSCRVPLAVVADAETTTADGLPLGYEVLACPLCTNALTLVHGTRTRYAYCPECRQRTLETPCIRLPDSDDGAHRVEIHEHCHLCGYMAVREASDPPRAPEKRGQVLPFRRGTSRKE